MVYTILKHLRFAIVALFLTTSLEAAVPTLIQYVDGVYTGNVLTGQASTQRDLPLVYPVLSGNALIVCGQSPDAETPTITDDQSGTYTIIQNTDDTGNTQRGYIAYRLNITNAPKFIRQKFVTAQTNTSIAHVSEWNNIATVSTNFKNNGTFGSSTTAAPGSITPFAANDLVIACAFIDSVDATTVTGGAITSWAVNSSMTFLKSDYWSAEAAAYRIVPDTSAFNPTFTLAPTRGWIAVQASFANATQGTANTNNPRIWGIIHQPLDYNTLGTSPFKMQLPIHNGSSAYAGYIGQNTSSITPTTLTDSANTWTATGAVVEVAGSGRVRGYYLNNLTQGDLVTSLAWTGANGASTPGDNLFVFEMSGMDTTAGIFQSGTDHATSSAVAPGDTTSTFNTSTITPRATGGFVFSHTGSADHGSGTPDAQTAVTAPTGAIFNSSTDLLQEVSDWQNDNNNGSVYWANGSTITSTTFTMMAGQAVGVGAWANITDFLGAPGPIVSPRPSITILGVGRE